MQNIFLAIISTLVYFSVIAPVVVNAQTSVAKPTVEFVFQMADEKQNIQQLSNDDIIKLQKFFSYQADLYDCDPQSVSLTAINLDENRKPSNRDVVGEIKEIGYAVMHLKCENNKVYFVINKSNNGAIFKKVESIPANINSYTTTTSNLLGTDSAQ